MAAAIRNLRPIEKPGPDLAAIGADVVRRLAEARDRYNESRAAAATARQHIIEQLARDEVAKGFPTRGRPGRIARALRRHFHIAISESHARKILGALSLRD